MSGHLRLQQQVQEMGVYLDKILSLLGRGDKEHVGTRELANVLSRTSKFRTL